MWIHDLALPCLVIQPHPQLLQPFTDADPSAGRSFLCLFWLIPTHSLGLSLHILFLKRQSSAFHNALCLSLLQSHHPVFPLCEYFLLSQKALRGSMVSCTFLCVLGNSAQWITEWTYDVLTPDPHLVAPLLPNRPVPCIVGTHARHQQAKPSWLLFLIFSDHCNFPPNASGHGALVRSWFLRRKITRVRFEDQWSTSKFLGRKS